MGRLERRLDLGLINKIKSGWKPTPGSWQFPEKRKQREALPRESRDYRWWRRAMSVHRAYLNRKSLLRLEGKQRHNMTRPKRPEDYATVKVLT